MEDLQTKVRVYPSAQQASVLLSKGYFLPTTREGNVFRNLCKSFCPPWGRRFAYRVSASMGGLPTEGSASRRTASGSGLPPGGSASAGSVSKMDLLNSPLVVTSSDSHCSSRYTSY